MDKKIRSVHQPVPLWAIHDLEIRFALVTNRVCRRAQVDLIRIGPSHFWRTIPREADTSPAAAASLTVLNRPNTHTDVHIGPWLHETQIVRSPSLAHVLAIPELEKSLVLPLTVETPFSMAGETETNAFEGCTDDVLLAGLDIGRLGMRNHLEIGCHAVDRDLLGPGTVVPDVDFEIVAVADFEVVLDCGGVERRRSDRRGQHAGCECKFKEMHDRYFCAFASFSVRQRLYIS
jgi:hypothetical protein